MQQAKQKAKQQVSGSQLCPPRSPCNECDYHKSGETKNCPKCMKCERRIAYNNFIDQTMGKTNFDFDDEPVLPNNKYKPKSVSHVKIEPIIYDCKKACPKIKWNLVKKEYLKTVVHKKKTLVALAKQFRTTSESIHRHRVNENWPEIEPLICDEEGCDRPAEIKDKCKGHYQRKWMRDKAKLKNSKKETHNK